MLFLVVPTIQFARLHCRAGRQSAAAALLNFVKKWIGLFVLVIIAEPVSASVRVYVEDAGGKALIKYECTAGEIIRAFALDVTVSEGQITGISDFFRGECTSAAQGYGFFPSAFRDHVVVTNGTNVNWDVSNYSPLAVPTDRSDDTQPGFNSAGVTLEFGALWRSDVPATSPPASGVLCALELSQPALVSIAENHARGGIVPVAPGGVIQKEFQAAFVDPEIIVTGIAVSNGVVTITFKGGELETANELSGPWVSTGNNSGSYSFAAGTAEVKFFRVRRQ